MSERKHIILTPEGKEITPSHENLDSFNENFQILVKKEALREELVGGYPEIINYLNRFGFEWESYSDYGHMRMNPYAALIFDLVAEYSRQVVRSLNLPLFEIKGTAFFNLDLKPVKEHAELYGGRLYLMETDKGKFVLRYAACHQQFALIKDWIISYKDLPFAAFEIADSYRLEQSGEVELCFRLRRFFMPDLHVFVRNEDEAKFWLMNIHHKIMEEIEKLGRSYELLINVVSPSEYVRYRDFLIEIAKDVGKPILITIYPSSELNYYWTINIEYIIIDKLKRPKEIGTVQIDIGNAKRFEITYIDETGEKHYPVILHSAVIGGLERYIYTLFDTALHLEKPTLPTWVSPIQVRLIPVAKEHLNYCIDIADKIEKHGFRVDIDDTKRSLSRKIVDAEREWIPYIAVVGEKEVANKTLTVRIRREGLQKNMTVNDLIKVLRNEVNGYPKKPIYFPRLLSKRPGFIYY